MTIKRAVPTNDCEYGAFRFFMEGYQDIFDKLSIDRKIQHINLIVL